MTEGEQQVVPGISMSPSGFSSICLSSLYSRQIIQWIYNTFWPLLFWLLATVSLIQA